MKKIMFNDKYGLTDAVLQGRKTMTRRIVPACILRMAQFETRELGGELTERIKDHTLYCYQEKVAVVQSYKSIFEESLNLQIPRYHWLDDHIDEKGYENKMFVKASEMPHHIRITDIKVERLQDISDEDCLREGIQAFDTQVGKTFVAGGVYVGQDARLKIAKRMINLAKPFKTPREAFAHLIDKVCVKGTWESNQWVFAYSFEKID